ncbi:hypothetical protein DENIT_10742 [Pseudomonas veronii]|nr:hypothetical protein DENIT_10742 [Pseudomonas veronii]
MYVGRSRGFSHRCACHSAPRRWHFFGALNLGLLLFCTKMYLLIKDTLLAWACVAESAPGFFASYKTI